MIFYLTEIIFYEKISVYGVKKDMYEIEVCYKIIFEAMLEKPVLKSIAEKINEYTGCLLYTSDAADE